jgi:ElaB/YqjD/DUF883 family membrane-anchored ribosome-binding protein
MEARLSSPVDETSISPTKRLVDNFKVIAQRAEQTARHRARAVDKTLRDHPYQTAGIAVGLGLLIGALVQRWWFTRA